MQDRVHLILQPGPLAHDVRAAQHLAAQRRRRRVRRHTAADSPRPAARPGSPQSTLSVFTFASAIARVLAGLDTTTRPARLASTVSRSPRCSRSPPTPPRPPARAVRRRPAPPPAWSRTGPPASPPRPARSRPARSRDARRARSTASSSWVSSSPLLLPRTATTDRERVGEATPTDPRAQRNRAGRRGGHLLTRALGPPNNTGLPTLLHSRRPCPGRSHRMPNDCTPPEASEQRNRRRRHLHTVSEPHRVHLRHRPAPHQDHPRAWLPRRRAS